MEMCAKVGDKIVDNDPRVPNRTLIIERVDGRYAYCRNEMPSFPSVRILLKRIFTDSRKRKSGFSIIRDTPQEGRR
jgi:hypothetical protein